MIVSYLNFVERVCKNEAETRRMSVKKRMSETSRTIISAAWLHLLPDVHAQPIDQVFSLGSLSHKEMGRLVLGAASRLDAFSAYPFLT